MEHEFIGPYIKTDSGLEHLIASMLPKKHSEDYSKHSMDSKDGQPAPEASEALVAQTEVRKLLKHATNVFRST